MAGVGFDAKVINNVMPEMKKVFGALSYFLTGVKTLVDYKPIPLFIKVDDNIKIEGYSVIIGNVKRYGAKTLTVTTNADMTDGLLDVCIFKKKKRLDFLRYAFKILAQRHTSCLDIGFLKAKRIEITANKSVLVHTDCEVIGSTPMEFTVFPKALKVTTPY